MTKDDNSVLVTPLAPPFSGKVMFVDFEPRGRCGPKTLAVSVPDADKITALLSAADLTGRTIVMEAAEDGRSIRISGVQ